MSSMEIIMVVLLFVTAFHGIVSDRIEYAGIALVLLLAYALGTFLIV